jgi:hypothetical protein
MQNPFTPRQCRERWKNYLDPRLQHTSWSPDEDARLLEGYYQLGNKWISLASRFEGRSGAAVRNRCLMLIRKKDRGPSHNNHEVSPPVDAEKQRPATFLSLCDSGSMCDFGNDDMLSFFFFGLGPENDPA